MATYSFDEDDNPVKREYTALTELAAEIKIEVMRLRQEVAKTNLSISEGISQLLMLLER